MQMCYFSSFVRHVVSHCIFYINLLLNLNVLVWVELHVHRFFFFDFLATSLLVYEVQNDFFFLEVLVQIKTQMQLGIQGCRSESMS